MRVLPALFIALGLAVSAAAQVITPTTAGSGSGGSSGGLTNTELRASSVPVVATVSGVSIDPRSIRVLTSSDQVTIANASIPVTGTFWQATQPVSGTFWQVTQPVSGTFWQATQPVSIATMPSTPVTGTFWQATQPVSLASVPTHGITIDQSTPGTTNGVRPDDSGATGSAVPARAAYLGASASGNLAGIIACDKSAAITAGAAATTQIIALSGTQTIYVCALNVSGGGAAGTMQIKYGTGTACGTGAVNLTGAMTTAIGVDIALGGNGLGTIFRTVAGQALCITMATASAVANGIVSYTQF